MSPILESHLVIKMFTTGQMFNALGVGVSYLLTKALVTKYENVEDRDHLYDITVLLSVYSGRAGWTSEFKIQIEKEFKEMVRRVIKIKWPFEKECLFHGRGNRSLSP